MRMRFSVDSIARLIGPILGPLAGLYTYCMFVHPWLAGRGSWEHVQNVWDRWQTFNAAALAFAASVIALQIARYREEKQGARDFRAAKAFLPAAFSELSAYFRISSQILQDTWRLQGPSAQFELPAAPVLYKEAFKECVRHATPVVGDYLASVLADLQVHEARLGALHKGAGGKNALLYQLRSLGHLQVRIDKQFDFARGEDEFDSTPPGWDNFKNAYSVLGIGSGRVGDFQDDLGNSLESLTKILIEKLNHRSDKPQG